MLNKAIVSGLLVAATAIGPTIFILPFYLPLADEIYASAIFMPIFFIMLLSSLVMAKVTSTLPAGASFNSIAKSCLPPRTSSLYKIITLLVIVSLLYANLCALYIFLDMNNIGKHWTVIIFIVLSYIFSIRVKSNVKLSFFSSLLFILLLYNFIIQYQPSSELINHHYNQAQVHSLNFAYLIPLTQGCFSFHIIVPAIVFSCNRQPKYYISALVFGMSLVLFTYFVWLKFASSFEFYASSNFNSSHSLLEMANNGFSYITHSQYFGFLILYTSLTSMLGLIIGLTNYANDLSKDFNNKYANKIILILLSFIPLLIFITNSDGFRSGILLAILGSTFISLFFPATSMLALISRSNIIKDQKLYRVISITLLLFGSISLVLNCSQFFGITM